MITLPTGFKTLFREGSSAVFEIEGLYPGFGVTIGNSIRRTLFSSTPGAAVVKFEIKNAPHEFTTLEGVKEDCIDIMLNIKQLRFRVIGDETETVSATLKANGVKEVTGEDFNLPANLELANPNQHIATLTSKKSDFELTVYVQKGLGYMLADELHKEKMPVGMIAVDAIFTPIKKVSYEVENMRVKDKTNYNRIRIHIETDGTITPEEALSNAVQIMIDHYTNLKETLEPSIMPKKTKISGDKQPSELENAGLSKRTINALTNSGITTLEALRSKMSNLKEIKGLGNKGIEEIKKIL